MCKESTVFHNYVTILHHLYIQSTHRVSQELIHMVPQNYTISIAYVTLLFMSAHGGQH